MILTPLPSATNRVWPPGLRSFGWVLLLVVGLVVPAATVARDQTSPQNKVVFDGNSLTSGVTGMNPADTYPSQCARLLGSDWQSVNAGVGGLSTFEMLRRAPTEIDALHRRSEPGRMDFLVVWEGSNDFAQNSATVDDAFTRLADYCRARRAAGWCVVLLTVLPRVAGPTFERDRQALNIRLRESWRGWADALADVAADPVLGEAGSARRIEYFLDGVHLTAAGNSRVAKIVGDTRLRLPAGAGR